MNEGKGVVKGPCVMVCCCAVLVSFFCYYYATWVFLLLILLLSTSKLPENTGTKGEGEKKPPGGER
jgi:hypothetical protein